MTSNGSLPMKTCQVTSRPRTIPLDTGGAPRTILSSHNTMKGMTNNATQFGCALAWEIIGGANPQNAAPTAAPTRESTRCRDSTQYQAEAVPASPPVRTRVKVAVGPKRMVTGVSGKARPYMAVFAERFTPSGWFCNVVNNRISKFSTLGAVTA